MYIRQLGQKQGSTGKCFESTTDQHQRSHQEE